LFNYLLSQTLNFYHRWSLINNFDITEEHQFMLGTTANAMAVMKTIVAKYGAAPRAFLVVPLVGAFFIDYANALVITVFANVMK
jgi:sodium--glutamate symport carrier gltS